MTAAQEIRELGNQFSLAIKRAQLVDADMKGDEAKSAKLSKEVFKDGWR